MEKDAVIKEVTRIIKKYLPKGYRVLLFGSWARGSALGTSDIDLGILGAKEAEWSTMTKILTEVEEIRTLRRIDVVDLRSVDDRFRDHVLAYAQTVG